MGQMQIQWTINGTDADTIDNYGDWILFADFSPFSLCETMFSGFLIALLYAKNFLKNEQSELGPYCLPVCSQEGIFFILDETAFKKRGKPIRASA